MKGKCDSTFCDKKAVAEYLVTRNNTAWTLKFCDKHNPRYTNNNFVLIDGKNEKEIRAGNS